MSIENKKAIAEQARILMELGIEIPNDTIQHTIELEKNLDEDILENLSLIAILLRDAGRGEYDATHDVYYPEYEDNNVYCFEMHLEPGVMLYTRLFKGIAAISNNEILVSDIIEDYGENYEAGIEPIKISFFYKETEYFFETVEYSWFDPKIFNLLNDILDKEGYDKRLYITSSSETLFVFYCTEDWSRKFIGTTGMELYTKIN